MAAAIAVVTALAWGCAEVVMLRAAKELGALRLAFWLMALGLPMILPIALIGGLPAGPVNPAAVVLPAVIGLAGSGLYLVALRDGKLSLVSPTVGTSGGIGAVLAVIVLGESLGPITVVFLVVAVAGVALAAITGRGGGSGGMGWAIAAAGLLGAYTVALAISTEALGPVWAVVAYRVTGLVVLGSILAVRRISPRVGGEALRTLLLATVLETVGFIAFTWALSIGPVAVVSVITAQFSTVAIILATLRLGERLRRHQWAGVVLMMAATTVLGAIQ